MSLWCHQCPHGVPKVSPGPLCPLGHVRLRPGQVAQSHGGDFWPGCPCPHQCPCPQQGPCACGDVPVPTGMSLSPRPGDFFSLRGFVPRVPMGVGAQGGPCAQHVAFAMGCPCPVPVALGTSCPACPHGCHRPACPHAQSPHTHRDPLSRCPCAHRSSCVPDVPLPRVSPCPWGSEGHPDTSCPP